MSINDAFAAYFTEMRNRFGNYFNHMNLGRTNFYPAEMETAFVYR